MSGDHISDLESQMATELQPKKVWIWKNGGHFWAFEDEFPCYPDGDPMTAGEPVGWAWLWPST